MHINDYSMLLLSNRRFLKIEYRRFVNNCYILQNIVGNIDSSILHTLIIKAKLNRKFRTMLSSILFYVDKDSISNENFQLLMHFSRKKRNTYLEAIAHADLAFYQMCIINRLTTSFEAFAWLFDRICENDLFSVEDMLQILRDASDITYCGVSSCVDFARDKYGNSDKLIAADRWSKSMNKQ